MAKSVKLADIAEKFGVSSVTVSKALSGQKGVSEEMREKIAAYAAELGYKQPSQIKQEKREQLKNKSFHIGVLIHDNYIDKYNAFYLQMYQQINTKAGMKGCFALLEVITSSIEQNMELPNLIKERKVDGVIIVGPMDQKYIKFLRAHMEVPLMFVDFCDDIRDTDAVVSDSYYGAYCLTKYLQRKGHKDIAYVGTVLSTSSITDRYLGYCKALMEEGIQPREDWKIADRDLQTGMVDEVNLIQLPKQMPTAFFCNCDLVASILIKKLEAAGYQVPQDISVVGYDNYLYPGLCDVEVTTYEVDMKEMARRAVNNLISKMSGLSYRSGIHIIEGHLVEKASVKDLKKE